MMSPRRMPTSSSPAEAWLLPPNWMDLTMWAVLMGRQSLARLLWEMTSEPTRAAILATRVCQRLVDESRGERDRFDSELSSHAEDYEAWAIDILDSIPESEEAARDRATRCALTA